MASDVDICNLALSHFGQAADLSSLSEESADADHCERFYPIARDELLEEYDWSFARKRATVAEVTNDRDDFAYKYALPADCLKPRRVLPDGYSDDQLDIAVWEREGDFIYTDEALSTLVYTRRLTDTTKFSPLFVISLSWRVSSYIAGPITKDQSGGTAMRLRKVSDTMAGQAKVSDANMDRKRAAHTATAQRAR
jgi:hypothetical protein